MLTARYSIQTRELKQRQESDKYADRGARSINKTRESRFHSRLKRTRKFHYPPGGFQVEVPEAHGRANKKWDKEMRWSEKSGAQGCVNVLA